jgi:hypothetical protein
MGADLETVQRQTLNLERIVTRMSRGMKYLSEATS